MRIGDKKQTSSQSNTVIMICALLSSLVPRYISTFKIRVGINISLYTIAVVVAFLFFSRRFVLYKKIQCYFIIIWFVFVVFSLWRSEQIGEWLYYLVWTFTAVLFAQVLYSSDKEKVFDCIIKGLVIGLVIHLIIGVIEISIHQYFFSVSIEGRSYYGKVPVSIFHNPNDYVTYLITVFPLLLYYTKQQKKAIKRLMCYIFAVLCLYLSIRSMSRTAFFAVVIMILALIWLIYKQSRNNKVLLIFFALILLCGLLLIPNLREKLFSPFVSYRVDIAYTDRLRFNLIRNALYFLEQTYGAGVGAGNLRAWLDNRAIYNIGTLLFVHNWYIELLVTFGVLFFGLYLVFHVKILVSLIKKFNPLSSVWNLDNSMLLSFIGFSVISIASSSNIYSEWIWMYLVFIGTYSMVREEE